MVPTTVSSWRTRNPELECPHNVTGMRWDVSASSNMERKTSGLMLCTERRQGSPKPWCGTTKLVFVIVLAFDGVRCAWYGRAWCSAS